MAKIRKALDPSQVTIVIDQQEKTPWDMSPFKTLSKHLVTGDYTILGLEHLICIERKSLADYLGSMGNDRDRFERELKRMLGYETRALIIEATWSDLEAGEWRSKVTPASALGSALGWIAMGIPVVLAGNAQNAARYAKKLMFIAARRRWRELVTFGEAAGL